jgi:hypothetical protein
VTDVVSGDRAPTIEAPPIEDTASLLYGAGPWEPRPPASSSLLPLVMTAGPNGPRGADGRWVLEQGPVEAWVGTSRAAADLRHKVVLR